MAYAMGFFKQEKGDDQRFGVCSIFTVGRNAAIIAAIVGFERSFLTVVPTFWVRVLAFLFCVVYTVNRMLYIPC